MGTILLIIGLLLGGAIATKAQPKATDYSADAIQLAARSSALLNQSPEITSKNIVELNLALEAIAQCSHPAANLVSQELQIHSFPYCNMHELRLYVDASADWVQKLLQDPKSIEKSPLRRFVALYELRLQTFEDLGGIVMLLLRSETPKNIKYIAGEISFADEIIMVEIPAPQGDGHDIEAKRITGGWIISYFYKYEDCISGCRKQCEWQFGVRSNQEVEFLGQYGELPQEWTDTKILVMKSEE